MKNKPNLSPYLLSRIHIISLSALALLLICKSAFESLNWYSASFVPALAVSILYEVLRTKRETKSAPTAPTLLFLKEKLEIALLITLGFEIAFQALGREFFPILCLVSPLLFAYLGWRAAALAVVLTSVFEITLYFDGAETFSRLFALLVSTFGLGYLIEKNIKDKDYGAYLEEVRKQMTKRFSAPKEDNTETQHLEPENLRKLRDGINSSLTTLNSILSPNTIVLYTRGKDGLFEVTDFISKDEKHIDAGQKLNLRSGYLGWAARTKTPISVGNLKNRRKNLIYYTRDTDVKSLLVYPVIEEDATASKQEPGGLLIIDSLKEDAFKDKEKQIVSLASGGIGEILSKFRLSERIQISSQKLDSFYEFTKKLSSTLELDAMLDQMVSTLAKILEADILGITLLDKEKNASVLKQVGKERRGEIEGKIVPHRNTLIGLVGKSKKYFHSEDLSGRRKYRSVFGKEIDFALRMQDIRSLLIYPLKETKLQTEDDAGESILGCIVIGRRRRNSFSETEINLAGTMSQEAAKAISNSLTYLKIKELAIKDGLTGLYNHRHFQEMLSHALARSDRFPEKVSLLLIDVDNLKQVNDTHGHKAGDTVLASVGLVISESLRRVDTSARYGGDEFAIILPNTGEKGARTVAEKIRQKVERIALKFREEELKITLSLGIAVYPQNASNKDSLIEKADRALYEAKRLGRNRIVYYEDIFSEERVS